MSDVCIFFVCLLDVKQATLFVSQTVCNTMYMYN